MTCVILISIQGVQATGRIAEFRDTFKKDPNPVLPRYVAGVTEQMLYAQPSPDQMFSYAKDAEEWSQQILTQLKEASVEVDEKIDRWIGDPVLVVFIDFTTNTAYTATFSPETGKVEATYEDTKTELWASLQFFREFIIYANQNTEEDTVDYAMSHYYRDWGVWVEMGGLDIMLTPDMIYSIMILGAGAGFLSYRYSRRRR